jgi:hypothetical protein
MPLDFHSDSQRLSIHFLDYLDFAGQSEFIEIKASLLYLDSLVAKSDQDHPDVQNFSQDLFDISHKLQTEHLNGSLQERTQRMAELFQQEVNALFNSLPNEIRGYHNLTLQSLLTHGQDDPSLKESVIDEIKALITPENLAKAKSPLLSSALLEKLKGKAKFTPQQLLKVLTACAVLSLPSSDKQGHDGPEGIYYHPEAFSQTISTRVAEAIAINTPTTETFQPPKAPETLTVPETDHPFQFLNQAPYPIEVVVAETKAMASRLEFVLRTPERRELFETLRNNPEHRDVVALIGIIESNLDVDAVSHSGAMGMMQDMGGLQGAFGDPDTVAHLAAEGLMPMVEDATYNRILRLHQNGVRIQRGTLLEYLIAQRSARTPFWEAFETEQAKLLINPSTSAVIANRYLQDLQEKATARLPIDGDPLEALNFAVMSYNLGMSHLHTLRRIMSQNGISDFSTHTVLSFMNRDDFQQILRDNNLGQLHDNYEEAQHYLARYIAIQELVTHNESRIPGSTTG